MCIRNDEPVPCVKAVKDAEKQTVRAYDALNRPVAIFDGVTDFSTFSVEGGEWSEPDPTENEQLRSDVDYCLMMLEDEE